MVLDKINIDFKNHDYLPEEKEAYQIGEEINEKIKAYLISGMDKGDLRDDLKIMPAIFSGVCCPVLFSLQQQEALLKQQEIGVEWIVK